MSFFLHFCLFCISAFFVLILKSNMQTKGKGSICMRIQKVYKVYYVPFNKINPVVKPQKNNPKYKIKISIAASCFLRRLSSSFVHLKFIYLHYLFKYHVIHRGYISVVLKPSDFTSDDFHNKRFFFFLHSKCSDVPFSYES